MWWCPSSESIVILIRCVLISCFRGSRDRAKYYSAFHSGENHGFWRSFTLLFPLAPQNFGRLALGCIEADFASNFWNLVRKLLTRSLRLTYLCTAQISNIQQKCVQRFCYVRCEFLKQFIFSANRVILCSMLNFNEILSDFRRFLEHSGIFCCRRVEI